MKIIVIALGVIILILGLGMGFLFFQMNQEPEVLPVASDSSEGEATPAPMIEERDAIYTSLNPAFLITYKSASGMRYLQTELQAMSYDIDVINEIDTNRPAIRNNIIMLLSSQEYSLLESNEGREIVRGLIKDTVQETLRTSLPVEEIYYNSFVIQ